MINFRVRVQRLTVAVSTLFFCVSCKPILFKNSDLPCELPSLNKKIVEFSSPLKVSLNVDGSGSMYGYVKDNPKSRYIKTLNLLDSVLNLGKQSRSQVSVEHYRVGETKTQPITSNQYQKAKLAEFYIGTNPLEFPKLSSNLDVAITEPEQEDQLFILVTDLDQKGRDLNKLNKKIQQTYLNEQYPGHAVGILGIKSEYNHTVFSIDTNVYPDFPYNTTGKELEEYRPFYVVFMGHYQDIIHYFEKMKNKNPDLINTSQFSVFYPNNIVNQITSIQNVNSLPQDVFRPTSLQIGKIAVEVNSPPYEILEIHKRIENQNPKIDYNIPFYPLKYTPPIDAQSIVTTTEIFTYNYDSEMFTESNNASLKNTINITNWNLTEDNFQFTSTLNLNSFPEPGIYLFKINAMAERLKDEEWWKDWDRQSRTSDDDGSKTYNLLNFMQNLKLTTTDLMNQRLIGHFCYAIQKN